MKWLDFVVVKMLSFIGNHIYWRSAPCCSGICGWPPRALDAACQGVPASAPPLSLPARSCLFRNTETHRKHHQQINQNTLLVSTIIIRIYVWLNPQWGGTAVHGETCKHSNSVLLTSTRCLKTEKETTTHLWCLDWHGAYSPVKNNL